ncbi:MAG TPA: choice-of-anchor D domain-containing protein, partial [Conexibacter sp.]|nr:choice-of-anchor D domain-containing protein [Conexibacter sp.]
LTSALLALAAAPAAAAPSPSPLSAQPAALDFGVVPVEWGEQTSSIWIQNSGPDPLQPGPASIDGSPSYRVTGDGCAGQTLGSGQGCNVGIGFDPGDGSAYAGTLRVPVADWDDLAVPLSGVGGVQQVTIAPQALTFGEVVVGDSATRSFTLTSSGTIPFQSFVALPTGGDVGAFRVERDGCSTQQLVPGQPCMISVRFAPLAPGAATATLLMIGGESQPAVVPLSGSGVAAATPPSAAPLGASSPTVATAAMVSTAGLLFDAPAGLPAPFAHGRVDLGRVRCATSARCHVAVRPRLYAIASDGAAIASIRGDVVLWHVGTEGARATLALPAGLRGRPALLVARLRTRAVGQRAGTSTLVVPLVHGHRAGATRVIRTPLHPRRR